jgi:hypothetical protein
LSPGRFEVRRIALGRLSIYASTIDHAAGAGASSSWQILSKADAESPSWLRPASPTGPRAHRPGHRRLALGRGTSTKTTDAQISSIFQKLMVNSREDIAGFIPQDQRNRVWAERTHSPRQSRDKPRSIPHG